MSLKPYPVTAWSAVNGLGHVDRRRSSRGCDVASPRYPSHRPEPRSRPSVARSTRASRPCPRRLLDIDSRNNRFVQQALAELAEPLATARERWGPERIGICVGSSTAAMDEIERAYSDVLQYGCTLPDALRCPRTRLRRAGLVRALRTLTRFDGPVAVLSNACASSGKAFASAKRWLEAGIVDAVLVGGADSLCQMTLRGFGSSGPSLSRSRRARSAKSAGGSISARAAAFALLERKRRWDRLLLGVGESSDAHHMNATRSGGPGSAGRHGGGARRRSGRCQTTSTT